MKQNSIELRIKAKSLAAEAAFIRLEKRRLRAKKRNEWLEKEARLDYHLKAIIRSAARETHLARMFLKGVPYHAVELKTFSAPNWAKVATMIRRYGNSDDRVLMQHFQEWKSDFEITVGPGKKKKS